MSQPTTDAEREQKVAEIREQVSYTADPDLTFLLAERGRLQQERDEAFRMRRFALQETLDAQESEKAAEAEIAKALGRLEKLIPATFHAGKELSVRIGIMVENWRKLATVNQQLEEELTRAIAEEREANVKAVCDYCRNSEPLTTNGELELCHYRLAENGRTKIILCRCAAAAIHERTREEQK